MYERLVIDNPLFGGGALHPFEIADQSLNLAVGPIELGCGAGEQNRIIQTAKRHEQVGVAEQDFGVGRAERESLPECKISFLDHALLTMPPRSARSRQRR